MSETVKTEVTFSGGWLAFAVACVAMLILTGRMPFGDSGWVRLDDGRVVECERIAAVYINSTVRCDTQVFPLAHVEAWGEE